MAVVSQTSVKHLVVEMLSDVVTHSYPAKWQIAARQTLSHANQIGHNLPVVDREPFAGAPEASHHLVGNHQDAVFLTQLTHTLHISVGRNQNAVGSNYSFEDEGRDCVCTLELDDFLDHRERCLGGLPAALNAMVRIEHAHYARNTGLRGPSPGITGQSDASGRGSMIGTVARHDLVPASKKAGDLDGIFVGFGTAIGEKKGIDVTRCDFGEFCAQARSRLRC